MTRAPAPTMEDSRFVLRGLLLMAAFGGFVAIVVSVALGTSLGGRGGDGWETYRNGEYGYEVRYPPDWTIEVEDPLSGDDLGSQSVRLVRDAAEVTVAWWPPGALDAVDFGSAWCESERIERHPVTVSDVGGEEYVCYARCAPAPLCAQEAVFLVRFFKNARDGFSYAVVGQPETDVETVRRIVESFRFVK